MSRMNALIMTGCRSSCATYSGGHAPVHFEITGEGPSADPELKGATRCLTTCVSIPGNHEIQHEFYPYVAS